MLEKYINNNFNEDLENKILSLDEYLIEVGMNYLDNYLFTKMAKEFYQDNNESYFDLATIKDVKQKLLSNDYLAERIIKLHLDEIFNKNDKYHDLFKAIIGGYVLTKDGNKFIDDLLNLDDGILLNIDNQDNYYKLVNDWSKHKYKMPININIVKENDLYKAILKLNDIDNEFESSSNTKYLAMINVSKLAYKYLEDNKLLLKMKDIVGEANLENCINQLQELYIKGFINEPIYKISLKGSSGGVDTWRCRIIVDGYKESFSFDDTSKKVVKRNAAYEMLKYILSSEK